MARIELAVSDFHVRKPTPERIRLQANVEIDPN